MTLGYLLQFCKQITAPLALYPGELRHRLCGIRTLKFGLDTSFLFTGIQSYLG